MILLQRSSHFYSVRDGVYVARNFAHQSFFVEACGCVRLQCRDPCVAPKVSATGTVVNAHTRRSTYAPKHSCVM